MGQGTFVIPAPGRGGMEILGFQATLVSRLQAERPVLKVRQTVAE